MLEAPALAYLDLGDATTDQKHEALAADEDDLTVQIKITSDGPWHRRAIDGRTTGCGEAVRQATAMHWHGYDLRKEVYAGELCDECFSPFELQLAAEANQKKEDER